MSLPKDGKTDTSRLEVPTASAASQLPSLSIEEDYFPLAQINTTAPGLSNTELPASLALPLSRTRSSTAPNTPTFLRAGPSVSVDDDNASIRSFVPTLAAGDDLENMLSEMLGSETRWRTDEDIDVWEGQSEDDDNTDSDLDENERLDDGTLLFGVLLMEEDKMIRWRSRRKHFFVLSAAGKPIYSRHGDDNVISGYMGVIQTIISFFEDNGDTLKLVHSGLNMLTIRSFATRTHRFVVIKEGPLYLVAISSLGESELQVFASCSD